MGVSFGIDVSEHNGKIDWNKVKNHIEFAMIRAGYGSKTVDTKFKENAGACTALNIPFGVYWFSYALNETMARQEAKKCLATVKPYKLSCPIAFDFEYSSMAYAKKKNVVISPSKMCAIASAFLDEIINSGYNALLYTNEDYWFNMGFKNLKNKYPIWCASWGKNKPAVYCQMWQDSSTGKIEGIEGDVDTDVSYVQYEVAPDAGEVNTKVDSVIQKYGEIYKDIGNKIISGNYGNGQNRIDKLIQEERDPAFAQEIVNAMIM